MATLWTFDGSCDPGEHGSLYDTFSLGIFPAEWTPKGRRTKRGKVVARVIGSTSFPQDARDTAKAICAWLNSGGDPDRLKKRIGAFASKDKWFVETKTEPPQCANAGAAETSHNACGGER